MRNRVRSRPILPAILWCLLASAATTQAQAANPCTDPPPSGVVVNPRTINALLPEFARTLVTGAVAIPSYEFGWMAEGATVPTTTLPAILKAGWTLATGTTACYTTQLPATVPIPIGQKFVAALRPIGDASIGNGPWSVPGNPFGVEAGPSATGKPTLR